MISLHRRIVASVVALTLASSVALAATTYTVDPVHSQLVFKIGHLGVSNQWGQIVGPTGTVTVDDEGVPSFAVEVKAVNVETNNDKRDDHLKSADFFDVKQFPTLSFKSTSGKKIDDTTFEITGDFTIKDVTKPLTVTMKKVGEADTKMAGYRAGYETSFKIKRSEYNMPTMIGPVGDEVTIHVAIEAVKE
jgi:polyisoprenoid-binding protein YceI